MKLSYLTFLVFNLNRAIDTGKYQNISIAEVEDHIREGDLLRYLKKRLGDDIDLSFLMPIEDFGAPADAHDAKRWIKGQVEGSKSAAKTGAELIKRLQSLLDYCGGEERRKFGVENSGLSLLIAWTTEMIQHKDWED